MAEAKPPASTGHHPSTAAGAQSPLDQARAKLAELREKAEGDQAKIDASKRRVEVAMEQWKRDRPDEPFDAHAFNPPMKAYEGDPAIHKEHHALHYKIAQLEQQAVEAAWSGA